jgi:hypothetical protein
MDIPSINTKDMEASACGLRVRLRLRTRRGVAEGKSSRQSAIAEEDHGDYLERAGAAEGKGSRQCGEAWQLRWIPGTDRSIRYSVEFFFSVDFLPFQSDAVRRTNR